MFNKILIFIKKRRKNMSKIKIQQVKSRIKCPAVQKRTLDALGLHKMNQIVEHEDVPSIRGMVKNVHHLVKVIEA
jgi:large subunit ribosomal protein L30